MTEATKNYQGGYKQGDIDNSDQRMYGPGVPMFSCYKTERERLFQTPLRAYCQDGKWYSGEPMGKYACNYDSTYLRKSRP